MSGSVVGMVVFQLNAMLMMKFGESVPQNVNFAIQAPIITNFLSVRGVTSKIQYSGDSIRSEMPPSAVAEVSKKFTVQIFCKGVSKTSSSSIDNQTLSGWTAH
jgi:hypothetical protein